MKVISITSSGPGEGKSTVISNLAIVMAQAGQKVLLIDCDLRKPRIHKNFGLNNRMGFTNAVVEKIDLDKTIAKSDENPNLDIMTSGPIPPNPSEILASQRNKEVIEKLKSMYDVILIDVPPIGVVTDAAIVSTLCDGVILVLPFGEVDVRSAKYAKELLDKVNAHILGTVLNKVPTSNKKYYGRYYYNYNYYCDD